MEKIIEKLMGKINEAYESNDVSKISVASKYFARILTEKLMEKDIENTKKICFESSKLRNRLEVTQNLKMDENYYFGYIYAYENMAKKLIEEDSNNFDLELVVSEYPKVIEIMKYLEENNYASHGEIAKHLKISISNLCNLFDRTAISKSNIFEFNKIGRKKLYYLTERGRQFYLNSCKEKNKVYTEDDVKKIIKLITSSRESLDEKDIRGYVKIFSDELLKIIYDSYMEHLNIEVASVFLKDRMDEINKEVYDRNKKEEEIEYCYNCEDYRSQSEQLQLSA